MVQKRLAIYFLALILPTLSLGDPASAGPPEPERAAADRNILIVILDDVGKDVATFYKTTEGRILTTPPPPALPNLTELKKKGVVFSNFTVQQECSPTRATLFTGLYGFRKNNGIGRWIKPDSPELPKSAFGLPKAFKAAKLNYLLASVGKWHLTYPGSPGAEHAPNTYGWDYHIGPASGGAVKDYFNYKILEQGNFRNSKVYLTTQETNDAIHVIERAKAERRPYLMWLAYNAPHIPYHKPPKDLHTYDSLPPTGASDRSYYEAMLQAEDTEIGRLLKSVNLSNTTVIVLGDNGTPASATAPPYNPKHGKSSIYQGAIDVPLLIAGAGVENPGRAEEGLAGGVDIYATALDLAGIDIDKVLPNGYKIDGVSLVPYLKSASARPVRKYSYSDGFQQNWEDHPERSVRNQRYKLLKRGNREQFFDLQNDPMEANNKLLGHLSPQETEALKDLRNELSALLASR